MNVICFFVDYGDMCIVNELFYVLFVDIVVVVIYLLGVDGVFEVDIGEYVFENWCY